MLHGSEELSRRQQILAAAERLFAHYGLAKTTVADIAREAGIGVGTVYLEFASKDEVVGALSAQCYEGVLAAMTRAANAEGSYASRLMAMFDAKVDHFVRLGAGGQHAAELVHCGARAVQSASQSFHEEELGLVVNLLREACGALEFDAPEPRRMARVLLRIYASFAPPRLYSERQSAITELLRATHEVVLQGLLRR